MWEQIASGSGVAGLGSVGRYDEELAEGQRGKLSLTLKSPAAPNIVRELQERLDKAGVLDAEVTPTTPGLDIKYRKGFPFLAVIVAAVLGIIVLAVLITSWQFFKEVKEVAEPIIEALPKGVWIAGAIVVIILIALIAFIIIRRQLPAGGGTE